METVGVHEGFTFQYGEIKRRLQILCEDYLLQFTFQYGEIKSPGEVTICCLQIKFTFQYGEIKSLL